MSLSKKMAGKSINKKNTRWRPKMEFVSKKQTIKRDKPGRPRKEVIIKTREQEIKNHKIPDTEKKKDGIILGMFLFSLILFTASLYFSQKKQELLENETNKIETTDIIDEDIPTTEIESWALNWEINTWSETLPEEDIPQETETTTLLWKFYESFNSGSILNIYPNIDNKLLSSKLFKVYFSKMRIGRFLKNISSEGVTISNIKEIWDTKKQVNYTMSYTLKDGHYFEETREMEVMQQDTLKIAKIMCISTWCSKLPFLNPGKYF